MLVPLIQVSEPEPSSEQHPPRVCSRGTKVLWVPQIKYAHHGQGQPGLVGIGLARFEIFMVHPMELRIAGSVVGLGDPERP